MMTRTRLPALYLLTLLAGLLAGYLLFRAGEAAAQPFDAAPAIVEAAPAAVPMPLAPEPTIAERLTEVIKAFEAYRGATEATAKRLLLFGAFAVGGKLVIEVLLLLVPALGTRGKKWIPIVALGLGVAVGLLSSLAVGTTLLLAVLYGAGPPLGVFVNELIKVFRAKAPA